jgi:hypothetical protein
MRLVPLFKILGTRLKSKPVANFDPRGDCGQNAYRFGAAFSSSEACEIKLRLVIARRQFISNQHPR